MCVCVCVCIEARDGFCSFVRMKVFTGVDGILWRFGGYSFWGRGFYSV